MRLTSWRLPLLIAAVAACSGTSEPKGSTLAGEYRLMSVDGKTLPADAFGTTYSVLDGTSLTVQDLVDMRYERQ